MRFDLATTIPFLLGLCGSAGALTGCYSCPHPSEYSSSATVHNGLQEEVMKALGDLHIALCDEYCTTLPADSVCTPTPGELPKETSARCNVTYPDGTVSTESTASTGYAAALSNGLGDCETFCRDAYNAQNPEATIHPSFDSCEVIGNVPYDYDLQCLFFVGCQGAGRAPRGLIRDAAGPVAGDPVATYWAEMAYLERASIVAFEELAEDLARLGAPSDLVDRALAAAGDEREHARVCGGLAEARGASPASPRVTEVPSRTLLDIALHNARHGCVNESFAALEALYQAANAEDPEVREALTRIGHDETRHGQLAWDIDAWARTALDPELHSLLDQERARAAEQLVIEAPRACGPRLSEVGLGRPSAIRFLARAFGEQALSAA